MTVFTQLVDVAKKSNNPEIAYRAAALIRQAATHGAEISQFRQLRQIHRDKLKRDGSRNGALVTGEMHPLEYEAIKLLCPALQNPNGEDRDKSWRWVLRQDWGKEFSAAPFEKTRF